jgi:hypothetical protein
MVFIESSVLCSALAHSDFGMQTFFAIKDPVSTNLHTGLSSSGTACPVTVIGGWDAGGTGGACCATAALLAAAATMNLTIRMTLSPFARNQT